MTNAPAAIEEYDDASQPIGLADIVSRDRPLVIRGLCRDWLLVKLAAQSDTAFAQGLAALDNGTEVDALLMPPGEDGVIGCNAHFDGFNYEHHRVSITQGLKRRARYSREETPPGGWRCRAHRLPRVCPGCRTTIRFRFSIPKSSRASGSAIRSPHRPTSTNTTTSLAWFAVADASRCSRRIRRRTCMSGHWISRLPALPSASPGSIAPTIRGSRG